MSGCRWEGGSSPETVGRIVPAELWGAYNLICGVTRSYVSKPRVAIAKVSPEL